MTLLMVQMLAVCLCAEIVKQETILNKTVSTVDYSDLLWLERGFSANNKANLISSMCVYVSVRHGMFSQCVAAQLIC